MCDAELGEHLGFEGVVASRHHPCLFEGGDSVLVSGLQVVRYTVKIVDRRLVGEDVRGFFGVEGQGSDITGFIGQAEELFPDGKDRFVEFDGLFIAFQGLVFLAAEVEEVAVEGADLCLAGVHPVEDGGEAEQFCGEGFVAGCGRFLYKGEDGLDFFIDANLRVLEQGFEALHEGGVARLRAVDGGQGEEGF